MVPIDKNIPLPKVQRSNVGNKYPWEALEVGDSFALDVPTLSAARTTASNQSRSKAPKRFRAGVHEGGFRIWRIE